MIAGCFIGTRFKMPTGVMLPWPTDTPPPGWLLCYCQAISRVSYARLFALIASTFGAGDGVNTFNMPDMRGRMPLGKDNMGGASANRVTHAQADLIGGSQGAENHTLITAEIPAHTHTIPTFVGAGAVTAAQVLASTAPGAINTGSTGGGAAHNNMQPYLTMNYIMKY